MDAKYNKPALRDHISHDFIYVKCLDVQFSGDKK